MVRRFVALLTLAALAGCIHVSDRGWSRHDRRVRAVASDCPALAAECRDECEEECKEECDDACEEACEEECDEECDDACEEKCEEACEEECEEECGEDDDDEDDEDDDKPVAPGAATGAADAAAQRDDLEYAVGAAERKLKRAREEQAQAAEDQAAAVERARHEMDDARRAVRHFEGVEKPTRLAKAELDLKDTVDYMTSQDEEMKQLELLYEQDDLGDKTKEIVLARGRRSHQRAQERLAIAKREFEDLKGFQLEQQKSKLMRELADKERAVKRAEFTARTTAEDKEQAIGEAERALQKARRELAKAAGGELRALGYGAK